MQHKHCQQQRMEGFVFFLGVKKNISSNTVNPVNLDERLSLSRFIMMTSSYNSRFTTANGKFRETEKMCTAKSMTKKYRSESLDRLRRVDLVLKKKKIRPPNSTSETLHSNKSNFLIFLIKIMYSFKIKETNQQVSQGCHDSRCNLEIRIVRNALRLPFNRHTEMEARILSCWFLFCPCSVFSMVLIGLITSWIINIHQSIRNIAELVHDWILRYVGVFLVRK